MDAIRALLDDALLLVSLACFLKVLTTLSILRFGLGWEGSGFGVVVIGLALAMTVLVMEPAFQGPTGSGETKQEFSAEQFMRKNTEEGFLARFATLARGAPSTETAQAKPPSTRVVAAAFLVQQVSEACILGFLILLPFVVIDLVIVHLATLLGAHGLQPQMVAVPAKLLLLIAANGWLRLTEKLVGSFSGVGV